jgi:hypothetical protein
MSQKVRIHLVLRVDERCIKLTVQVTSNVVVWHSACSFETPSEMVSAIDTTDNVRLLNLCKLQKWVAYSTYVAPRLDNLTGAIGHRSVFAAAY